MADGKYTLAIIDPATGILQGFETVNDELLWVASEGREPVPNGCDLALKRYQLKVDTRTGKRVFVPIVHDKDKPAENTKEAPEILPALARLVHRIGFDANRTMSGQEVKDWMAVETYLKSFDAQG